MKPIKINICDTEIVITHLEVLSHGVMDIEFDHDGKTDENVLTKAVGEFILASLEDSVKDLDE